MKYCLVSCLGKEEMRLTSFSVNCKKVQYLAYGQGVVLWICGFGEGLYQDAILRHLVMMWGMGYWLYVNSVNKKNFLKLTVTYWYDYWFMGDWPWTGGHCDLELWSCVAIDVVLTNQSESGSSEKRHKYTGERKSWGGFWW